MKATLFVSQPFVVTAVKVTEKNMDDIARWCLGHVIRDADKPFVRVPVSRPTSQKQTQAFAGTWVLLSTVRGEDSFKVYTEEWLMKTFNRLPQEIDILGTDEDDDDDDDDADSYEDDDYDRVSRNSHDRSVAGDHKSPVLFRSAT